MKKIEEQGKKGSPILSRIEACVDVMITQRNPARHYTQKSHKPGETKNSKKPEIEQICQSCLQIPKKGLNKGRIENLTHN